MVSGLLIALALGATGFDSIVAGVSERTHQASCTAMLAWANENPGDPRARQGKVWCGRLLWSDGNFVAARPVLEQVSGDHDVALLAVSTLSQLELSEGNYEKAARASQRLASSSVELWRYTGAQTLLQVRRAQRVWWQAAAGAILLAGWLAMRGFAVRRSLWPVPGEVAVLAPLLLLLAATAISQTDEVARALATLVVGGIAVTWFNGAYWRARPLKRRWLEALKGLAQGLILLDLVLVSAGLWAPLWESLTGGFD